MVTGMVRIGRTVVKLSGQPDADGVLRSVRIVDVTGPVPEVSCLNLSEWEEIGAAADEMKERWNEILSSGISQDRSTVGP